MALRIKDEVDLKELEKFGFVFDEESGKYIFNKKCKNDKGGISLTVQSWNRKIYVWSNTNNVKDEEIIAKTYDLIQAELVEKVSD